MPLNGFAFGNSGRNILDGPGSNAINLALNRNFSLREKARLQVRSGSLRRPQPFEFRSPGNRRECAQCRHHHVCGRSTPDAGGSSLDLLMQLSRRTLLAGLSAVGSVHAQRLCPQPNYDLRTDLKPRRVTNAMWDFSWLKSHYPGGPFENWHKVTDELLARGFNTVRLDAFPYHRSPKTNSEAITIEAKPLANWGFSDRDYAHPIAQDLVEFMRILKQKGINAILSNWGNVCREYPTSANPGPRSPGLSEILEKNARHAGREGPAHARALCRSRPGVPLLQSLQCRVQGMGRG